MKMASSMTPAECSIWLAAFERCYLSWTGLTHERREQIAAQVADAAVEGSRVKVEAPPEGSLLASIAAELEGVGAKRGQQAPQIPDNADEIADEARASAASAIARGRSSTRGRPPNELGFVATVLSLLWGNRGAGQVLGYDERWIGRLRTVVKRNLGIYFEAAKLAHDLQRRHGEKRAA